MNKDLSVTLAIDHLKLARTRLGNRLVTMFQEANREDALTLRLDASMMTLADGINDLSNVITKLDWRGEYIVKLSDNQGIVIQERRYARGLGQALQWTEEMQEEFQGLPFEASIEER
jgi:hypothetical protein